MTKKTLSKSKPESSAQPESDDVFALLAQVEFVSWTILPDTKLKKALYEDRKVISKASRRRYKRKSRAK